MTETIDHTCLNPGFESFGLDLPLSGINPEHALATGRALTSDGYEIEYARTVIGTSDRTVGSLVSEVVGGRLYEIENPLNMRVIGSVYYIDDQGREYLLPGVAVWKKIDT